VGVAVERFAVAVGGDAVVGVLHRPEGARAPCAVACHGMGASKDSDKYLLLARDFPPAGIALARFDFRGSGESGGSSESATIESRIADVEAVLDHLAHHPGLDGRMGLLGSSLGGFVSLWVGARRPAVPVVTWNAPARLDDLERGLAEASGPAPALIAEVQAGRFAEVPRGARGVLVVHADRDEVVPLPHAHLILGRVGEPRALRIVAGADHRLSEPGHRLAAAAWSRDWLLSHLG
jgi:alpha/beta superfamily hydrolase